MCPDCKQDIPALYDGRCHACWREHARAHAHDWDHITCTDNPVDSTDWLGTIVALLFFGFMAAIVIAVVYAGITSDDAQRSLKEMCHRLSVTCTK